MSNAISQAHSLQKVIDIINESNPTQYFGGSDTREPEVMAGQYAWDAARESDYTEAEDMTGHLTLLKEAGAKFDFKLALKEALNMKREFIDFL